MSVAACVKSVARPFPVRMEKRKAAGGPKTARLCRWRIATPPPSETGGVAEGRGGMPLTSSPLTPSPALSVRYASATVAPISAERPPIVTRK